MKKTAVIILISLASIGATAQTKNKTVTIDSTVTHVQVAGKTIPAQAFKLPVVFFTGELVQYLQQLFAASDIPSNKVTAFWQALEEQQKTFTPAAAAPPPKK